MTPEQKIMPLYTTACDFEGRGTGAWSVRISILFGISVGGAKLSYDARLGDMPNGRTIYYLSYMVLRLSDNCLRRTYRERRTRPKR